MVDVGERVSRFKYYIYDFLGGWFPEITVYLLATQNTFDLKKCALHSQLIVRLPASIRFHAELCSSKEMMLTGLTWILSINTPEPELRQTP